MQINADFRHILLVLNILFFFLEFLEIWSIVMRIIEDNGKKTVGLLKVFPEVKEKNI